MAALLGEESAVLEPENPPSADSSLSPLNLKRRFPDAFLEPVQAAQSAAKR